MNFNLFQSSNNNQLGQSPLDFMSDDDGELDFSAVMQQELESHDLLLMQSEGAAHHHPLSPPTVIIPSSSSNNINNNCAAADDGDLYKSNVLASVGDHQNMMFPLNFVGGHTTPHVNTTTSNDQQQHSPRTPRLNLDAASVLQSWLLILDNTITNNNNNNINNNNNNHNNSSTTTPIHNNNNNLNNNNNNINLNNINHHATYNNTTSDQNLQDTLENLIQNNKHHQQIHDMLTNSNNNTTTSMQSQSYLGSVLANCTSIHSPNMRSTMNQRSNNHSHQHSKSPSFGSGNYNSKLNSGVRKASSQRSNSTSCFQSIQSYTASKMHLAAATSMMNMNGGLNSPSVASTCSSNLTMSPANVSTNSFNQLINNNNNGHMGYMSNSNSNNNSSSATVGSSSNQQYSPIVTNQQQMVAGATVSGSNKKGKLPANRPVVDKNSNNQFTFVNSQHSKGLLVEANPNDKPIKMQQCKIVDGGIKIQIEDGISKNKKDTGLQFHTCTFK